MKDKAVLGIDTSCYTTSLALLDLEGRLIADERIILKVKEGGCGLAQSEMVFLHTRNLPALAAKIGREHACEICAVGVTTRPRPREDSYMPAFLTGKGLAESFTALNGLPLYTLSHQENHLLAALWSAGCTDEESFLFLHASGGTTDILLAERREDGYSLETVGESTDLHAGQFVDRVGVALGLAFPAGRHLEELAGQAEKPAELPVSVQKNNLSFAGPCSAALRLKEKGIAAADLARGVELAIGETFYRVLRNICAERKIRRVLLAGGVSSNTFIRQHMAARLGKKGIALLLPEARYSPDNAVGAAVYALQQFRKGK